MTKAIFIETVFNRVYGGRPTSDFSVHKADIEAFLPACCNYALMKGYWTQQSEEKNRDIPTTFYYTYRSLAVVKEESRKYPHFVLPVKILAMPSNRGLRKVMDHNDRVYAPLPETGMTDVEYWLNIFSGESFYRIEGNKVYLYNKPSFIDKMAILALVETEHIGDDDELPLPAGTEIDALNMCYEFVTGIRQMPADGKLDGNDINRQ